MKTYKLINEKKEVIGNYSNVDLAKNKLHNISKNLNIKLILINAKTLEIIAVKGA